jgi:hypothetical protein
MLAFRRLSFYIGTLVSILILGSFVAAQDNSVRKELEALYAKRDEAYKRKDAGFIISLLAEDYTSKDLNGKVKNRAQEAQNIELTFFASTEDYSVVTKVESVKEGKDKNEAIVESSTARAGLEGLDKVRDTWVRTVAGWKLRYSEELREEEAPWIKYTSPEGGYSALLPTQPTLDTEQSNSAAPKTYTAFSVGGFPPGIIEIRYFDLSPNQSFSLDDLRASEIKRLKNIKNKGTLVSDKPISLDGYPGRQLVVLERSKDDRTVTISRVYKVGQRAYTISFELGTADESYALKSGGTKFFDSFQITKKP